jgi:ABC-2 type transport system permease protein
LSGLILLLGALVFALYGLCFGLAFRSEAAVSGAGGSVVVLGFLGNIFFPLSGALLAIAKWTPLYGYAALARYPITGGWILDSSGSATHEPLWVPLTNVATWLVILAVVAGWLVRRSRARQ